MELENRQERERERKSHANNQQNFSQMFKNTCFFRIIAVIRRKKVRAIQCSSSCFESLKSLIYFQKYRKANKSQSTQHTHKKEGLEWRRTKKHVIEWRINFYLWPNSNAVVIQALARQWSERLNGIASRKWYIIINFEIRALKNLASKTKQKREKKKLPNGICVQKELLEHWNTWCIFPFIQHKKEEKNAHIQVIWYGYHGKYWNRFESDMRIHISVDPKKNRTYPYRANRNNMCPPHIHLSSHPTTSFSFSSISIWLKNLAMKCILIIISKHAHCPSLTHIQLLPFCFLNFCFVWLLLLMSFIQYPISIFLHLCWEKMIKFADQNSIYPCVNEALARAFRSV